MSTPLGSYYVSTPIYYVNDAPHVGHCYTTVLADVAARFARLLGRETFFLTGTDEHAEKVVESAAAHGMTPLAWADRNAAAFEGAFERLNVANDDFVRTTEERHTSRVQGYIRRLRDEGFVYLGDYEGWFDPSQEEYVTESTAREHEFASPVTGKPLVKRTERNYFFKLSAFAEPLRAHIEEHAGFIRPEARRNEVLGRIRDGLQDVPISRAVRADDPASAWGVLMPDDAEHRVYVWIDALFNYLTVVDTPERRHLWPAQVHLIAKDILWFHAVIWPSMLLALAEPLPGCVYAHSYWVREGRKMSKSLGNFVDGATIDAYCARFGRDALRWFLTTQGPLGANDADFAHGRFVEVYNSDLANGIGNAVSRVTSMIGRYFDGVLPRPAGTSYADHDWPALSADAVADATEAFERVDVAAAVFAGVQLAARVDGFVHKTEPFRLAKDDSRRGDVATILYQSAEALRIASLLMWPAMPEKCEEIQRRLGYALPLGETPLAEAARWAALAPGARIEQGEPLFQRADPDEAPPEPARAR